MSIEHLNNGLISQSIKSESIAEIKEHVGESFVSQKITISQGRLDHFLKATGDINAVHLDERQAIKSALSEKTGGRVVVPGFLTLSICADEKVLWEALKINEPHEIVSLRVNNVKYKAPVPVNAKVIYEYRLRSSNDKIIGDRPSNVVDWDIKAFVLSESGEKTLCMKATWTVAYISLIAPSSY